jgi:hypothetical protein
MIVIHDEGISQQLEQIAERERRPVEAVLKDLLAAYPISTPAPRPSMDERVRQVRLKAYVKARLYWESVGDAARAALTDAELDEQFGAFDEQGIPRLKHELPADWPPVGSLAYAADMATTANLHTGKTVDARRADDILNAEFADCCIMTLAERLNITQICTLDECDFSLFRPDHIERLELLP